VLGIPHAVVDIAPSAPLEIPRLGERKDEVRGRADGVPAVVLGSTAQRRANSRSQSGRPGVLDTRAYCDTAESFARKMAELPVFTDIPDHLVSAV
jgi:hypothetical protein